ncbi:hypothetical protein [Candidatus Nitrotoga sp. 1052]|uniref:hypothetical protein n=1 Tax=Candidatus Nitrotoga sp. 1052 TaxID=2886964 RepID=UPI001EF4C64A|nr:hypothetical protein [Candidatus Nitrotoga sp. 1052]
MAKLDYDAALGKLRNSAGNLRCSEVKAILKALGFIVRDGKKGNHKTFSHPSIPDFFGSNYDCGHGKDAQVKKWYIDTIIEVLERLENDIKTHYN